jgi:hypothetical protein
MMKGSKKVVNDRTDEQFGGGINIMLGIGVPQWVWIG